MSTRRSNLCLSAIFLLGYAGASYSQIMPWMGGGPMIMPGSPVGAGGQVNLPYMTSDAGGMWFIYGDGALRQQTGQPIYQQGGVLTLDGNSFNAMNNQAIVDPK